jgi:multidrug efflux system outer membrane protein
MVAAVLLAGCMVGPEYKRPVVESPPAWRVEEKEAKDVANTAWWEQFNDPVLNELIREALQENKDLKIAAARIEQFMGQYAVTRAGMYPQVGAGASGGMQRLSEKGTVPLPPGTTNPDDFYQMFLSGSWEIDIWGKIRRASQAARADILSSEEGRRAVTLSLVAAVASAYIDLRDLDWELEISKKTAESRKESLRIFQARFGYGYTSAVEVSMVKSEYEEALANIFYYGKLVAQLENEISVLLGRNPGPIPRGKPLDEITFPAVPAGLPSDLLTRRPDILQAEQNLIAANARIGVAKALYYPSISLTGAFGFASTDLSQLFTGSANTWSWAVPVSAPIFTAGAISGQVKSAEAVQQQALIRYQQVIQTAFREVNDSLIDQKQTKEQVEALGRRVKALKEYARLARLRYDNGYTGYLEVLDADRNLFAAQLNYSQTMAVLFRSSVSLYKAMGGGWVNIAEGMAQQESPKAGEGTPAATSPTTHQ